MYNTSAHNEKGLKTFGNHLAPMVSIVGSNNNRVKGELSMVVVLWLVKSVNGIAFGVIVYDCRLLCL